MNRSSKCKNLFEDINWKKLIVLPIGCNEIHEFKKNTKCI